jgi:hypothetical protein
VVVVSLSKGSADVKAALAAPGGQAAFAKVAAWIDLSGTTEGTPVVDWLQGVWWRWLAIRLTLAVRRQPLEAIRELGAASGPLARPAVLPVGMTHIRVLGFPLRRHLHHPWSRRAFARLELMGPNDGGGVLLQRAMELCRGPGSVVLPVWGADHYLRPSGWDFDRSLGALLRVCVARPASQ